MIKVIITEEEKSNKPVAILTLETQISVFDYWAQTLVDNPGKYKIEINIVYTFSDKCSESWHSIFGALAIVHHEKDGTFTDTGSKGAFFGTIQGFAWALERERLGE